MSQVEKPLPLTEDDVEDIRAVAEARVGTSSDNNSATVTVTYTNGGAIVSVANFVYATPATVLRNALQKVGYMMVGEDFAYNAVVVVGRDPGHVWSKST